jgi:hypothetical protein
MLRRNMVYDNWGEGLSTYQSNGTIMESNEVYDNWQTNIYISDSTNALVQRNLVYNTGMGITTGKRVGIMMGDEVFKPPSSNIKVINNFCLANNVNFQYWRDHAGRMKNVLVAYNTFANSRGDSNVYIAPADHQNVRFENNIIEQDDNLSIVNVQDPTGITFSNNLWSRAPMITVSSPTDVIGDPKLAKVGSISPGLLTYEYFKLLPTSPAINRAKIQGEVIEDFIRNPRGSNPDIGAVEYVSGSQNHPSNTPSIPSVPTSGSIGTPTAIPFQQQI